MNSNLIIVQENPREPLPLLVCCLTIEADNGSMPGNVSKD